MAHYVELNQDPLANNNPTNDTPLRRTIYSNVNGYESEEAMLVWCLRPRKYQHLYFNTDDNHDSLHRVKVLVTRE